MNGIRLLLTSFLAMSFSLNSCKENEEENKTSPEIVLEITHASSKGNIQLDGFIQDISDSPVEYKIAGPFFRNFSLHNVSDLSKMYFS